MKYLALFTCILLTGCLRFHAYPTTYPAHATPEFPEGTSLDEVAVSCLKWGMIKSRGKREVAGGVYWSRNGNLTCSRLTYGTRNFVNVEIQPEWLVIFHTHISAGTGLSELDREAVREDPLRRPSYVINAFHHVWVYECNVETPTSKWDDKPHVIHKPIMICKQRTVII